MKERGQTLVFLVVMIPTLLILSGVVIRSGQTLLIHQQSQNHCDKKVLDALAEEAKGLSLLGNLNSEAKQIIDTRRNIERALSAGMIFPLLIPAALSLAETLRGAQLTLATEQKLISSNAIASALIVLSKPPFSSHLKTTEKFTPFNPTLTHRSKNALVLHVQDRPGYEGETGAPKTLDIDFEKRQQINGVIEIQTEKFLSWWPKFRKIPDMQVFCEGKIDMTRLEDKWKVKLAPTADKPSLKVSSALR